MRAPGVPRFVVDGMHRTASLLAVAFLAVHIVTAVLDSFASISLLDAVIPFVGSYRPLWLGLGAVAFDLLLAVAITSLVRDRMGHATWRGIHWLAYAAWPVAVVHGFGTGSDVHQGWLEAINVACILAVLAAVVGRAMIGWPAEPPPASRGPGDVRRLCRRPGRVAPGRPAGHGLGATRGHPGVAAHACVNAGAARMSLPRVLLGADAGTMDYATHLRVHGELPVAARRSRGGGPAPLLAELTEAGLRGRGGGAFPLAAKLEAVRRRKGTPVVVVNGAEGEPMSVKDRMLLEALPHLVLDGAACLADLLGTRDIVIALDESMRDGEATIRHAVRERPEARGRAGQPRIVSVPAGYVTGHETAVVNFVNRGVARPTTQPPRISRARHRPAPYAHVQRRDARPRRAHRASRRRVVSRARSRGRARLGAGHAERRRAGAGRL